MELAAGYPQQDIFFRAERRTLRTLRIAIRSKPAAELFIGEFT